MEPFHEQSRVRIGHGLNPFRKRGRVHAVQVLREFADAFESRSVDWRSNAFDLPFREAVLVDAGNPSHGLMRWSNVVAGGGKDDDRIVDTAEISKASVADTKGALFEP